MLTGPPSLTVPRTENRPEPPEGVGWWRGGEAGLSGAEWFCGAAGGGGGGVRRGRETSGWLDAHLVQTVAEPR